jgi:hypothetical protein
MKNEYQKLSNGSDGNHRDSILTIEDSNNPFAVKKSWDEFKKEYYALEKKIKKSLENLHLIQIEFTKHISFMEYFDMIIMRCLGLKELLPSIKQLFTKIS